MTIERAAEVIDALEPFALEVRDVQRGWLAKEIAQALSDAGLLAGGDGVIVPREPTHEMRSAGATVFLDAIRPGGNDREVCLRIYRAMIGNASLPLPPAEG